MLRLRAAPLSMLTSNPPHTGGTSMAVKKVVKKEVKKVKATAKKVVAKPNGKFRLTYATMFNPPEKMHTDFDKAVAKVRAEMGRDVQMLINGEDRFIETKFEDRSPINTEW